MAKKKETPQHRWAKKNRDKLRAACRRWRARHPDRQKAATYRWRKENRGKWNRYMRRWRRKNPAVVRDYTQKRWRKIKRDPLRYARHLAAARKWDAKHPDVRKRRARRYRRMNRSRIRKYGRRWMNHWYRTHRTEARRKARSRRKKNLEKWRARDRRYYRKKLRNNPEYLAKQRTRGRLWVKKNPLKQRQRVAVYRARKMGARGSHTLEQWLGVVHRHSWKCFYCGKHSTAKR